MYRPSEHTPGDPRRSRHGRARGAEVRAGPSAPAPRRGATLHLPEGVPIRGAWLLAPMLLLALACALRLAVRGADSSFELCFALLLGMGVAWTTIRLWSPSVEAPACPHCKRSSLVRLQPMHTAGARCLHCGWVDTQLDSTQLGVLVVVRAHVRGATQGQRPLLGPRHEQRRDPSQRPGPPPGRGPSGRGRRLR